MARPQADDGSQAAHTEDHGLSSASKPFPQRYTVVEHHPGGSSTVSQSSTPAMGSHSSADSGAGIKSESERFMRNSKAMEERATNDLRDTLRWVSRMSNGPVDRRLLREAARSMKPNAYRDVMTERWVADMCAYPACEQPPRRPYNGDQPMYRINLRAKRVFDTSAAMKYCSDECARRSIWYETVCLQQNAFEVPDLSQPVQLLEDTETATPAQEDAASTTVLPSDQILRLEASITRRDALPTERTSLKQNNEGFAEQAETFLARLSIVERQPTSTPLPPSEDYADEINQEDNPSLSYSSPGPGELASTAFNMETLDQALQSPQETDSGTITFVEEGAGLARRIEIDVDPAYRDLLDAGFELYKQMKEAGEFD